MRKFLTPPSPFSPSRAPKVGGGGVRGEDNVDSSAHHDNSLRGGQFLVEALESNNFLV